MGQYAFTSARPSSLDIALIMKHPSATDIVATVPTLAADSCSAPPAEPAMVLKKEQDDLRSAYMAIAASAFGLISDGCKLALLHVT